MVGTKGCSGGWRAGAGRRPDATTMKKKSKVKSTKPNEKQSNEKQSAFFKNWHNKMIAQAAESKAQQLAEAAARKANQPA
jgi:hypothetical protein